MKLEKGEWKRIESQREKGERGRVGRIKGSYQGAAMAVGNFAIEKRLNESLIEYII
jgi:NAD(P)H-hydrate repair Nnr-like enzyme with NAD(P)H-hydrate dehydratase domain